MCENRSAERPCGHVRCEVTLPILQHSMWSVSQLCLILFPPLTKTKMVVWHCLKTHRHTHKETQSTIAWLSDKAISKTRLVCWTPKRYIAKQGMTKISCLAWHSRKFPLAAASFISFSYLHQVTMTFWNSLLIQFVFFVFIITFLVNAEINVLASL